MTFLELQSAIARLANDPRVHDSTPVEFDLTTTYSDGDIGASHEPLVAAHVESSPRRIVFTDRETRVDVAR